MKINDLFFIVVYTFKSVKPEQWLKEGGDYEPVVAPISGMYSISNSYLAALKQLGIAHNTPAQISCFESTPCTSGKFHSNWERYPGNNIFDLKAEITIELQNLYMAGKGNKTNIGDLLKIRNMILFLIQ